MHKSIYFILALLVSCSHHGLEVPPSKDRILSLWKEPNVDLKELNENEKAALVLKKAEKDNYQNCFDLISLSKRNDFPLSKLATLKSIENCDLPEEKLVQIWQQEDQIPRWLKKRFNEVSLQLANKHSLVDYQAKFSLKVIKGKRLQKEREEVLLTAISSAKRAKNIEALNELTEKLYDVAPRYNKVITKENIYSVARDFERNRSFKKARNLYTKIIRYRNYTIDEKVKAWNRLRLSHKIERDKKTYLKETARMVSFLKKYYRKNRNSKVHHYLVDSIITLSRAQWTEHMRSKAERTLKDLNKRYSPDNKELAKSYWLLGSMRLEAKDFKRSRYYYEKAFNLDPKSENIAWSLGWNLYTDKNFKEAKNLFSRYVEENPDTQRFRFWLAKTHLHLKENDEAEDLFKEIISIDPMEYYSFLSHLELNKEINPIDNFDEITALEDSTFEWLYSLGEIDIAKDYLKSMRRVWKGKKRIASLPLYERVGYYDAMISQVYSIPSEDRKDLLLENPTFAFPKPFKQEVERASKKFNVAPELIYAISRQESGFNQHARSWADAFGVMQLIPEKAKVLGQRYKIPYKDHYDLFTPKTNVLLGASLLGELQKRFNGKFPLYVASYNASGQAVKRWYDERFDGDFIEFIEMIPYAETRKYVKLVLRNFFIYKKMNTEDDIVFNRSFFTSES